MKILVAIVTCAAYRHRADAQRETWVKDMASAFPSADVRFFFGASGPRLRDDEVVLPVDDGYETLPLKVQRMFRWALDEGYDWVFKLDDDVYLRPERLATSVPSAPHEYCGRLRGASGKYPAPYASGFSYWISAKAMSLVVRSAWTGDKAEDRWIGNLLSRKNVFCYPDYRFVVVQAKKSASSSQEGPRSGNEIISACEYEGAEEMRRAHEEFLTLPSVPEEEGLPEGKLSRVGVMIKTFLRDGYMMEAVRGCEVSLPECKMVIVDDGIEAKRKITFYSELRRKGHKCVWLPTDSGFGAKANTALAYLDREYVLIGSDDFDFAGEGVREGVERLMDVLDSCPWIAVASGRVDNKPYEGTIERGDRYIREHRLSEEGFSQTEAGTEYKECDLTVNYSLIRRSILGMDKIHWHAEWKIGGDHFQFFDDVRKAGHKIAFVRGANINQLPFNSSWQHPDYPRMRARARKSLPGFFKKQSIDRYIGFDGRVDTIQT